MILSTMEYRLEQNIIDYLMQLIKINYHKLKMQGLRFNPKTSILKMNQETQHYFMWQKLQIMIFVNF